jgi:phospholipase/carboxylesterase
MRMLTAGPLTVRALGGDDRLGGGEGPCIVLLHGYGVPGNDLVLIPRRVRPGSGVRWYFPEGPLASDDEPAALRRAWYPLDHQAIQRRVEAGLSPYPLSADVPPGMLDASAQLDACLTALTLEHGLVPARTVIGGFSQGAVMATELSLRHRSAFAGVALMSGRLLDPQRLSAPLQARGPSFDAFQSHGTTDAVIPLENGLALRSALQAHGATVEWHAYAGGHAITSEVHAALEAYCVRRLYPPHPKP